MIKLEEGKSGYFSFHISLFQTKCKLAEKQWRHSTCSNGARQLDICHQGGPLKQKGGMALATIPPRCQSRIRLLTQLTQSATENTESAEKFLLKASVDSVFSVAKFFTQSATENAESVEKFLLKASVDSVFSVAKLFTQSATENTESVEKFLFKASVDSVFSVTKLFTQSATENTESAEKFLLKASVDSVFSVAKLF